MSERRSELNLARLYPLSPSQRMAAEELNCDVIVTAGAGSGKTRTLVAHYLYALSHGATPRSAVAITFTEKAALEMRSRVRAAVSQLAARASDPIQRAHWRELEAGMDAARIGTIHSLCAEILRSHPAEAAIDPQYSVLEEGMVQALKAKVVIDTIAWAADQRDVVDIFHTFSTRRLADILLEALEKRLDILPALSGKGFFSPLAFLEETLTSFFREQRVNEALTALRDLKRSDRLEEDAGEALAEQVRRLLERVDSIQEGLKDEDLYPAATAAYLLRREELKRGAGRKDSEAKRCLVELQAAYDELLNPWLGGQKSTDTPPSEAIEVTYRESYPILIQVIAHAFQTYREALDARSALDFDDLEQGAVGLLKREPIRAHWQERVQVLMVDEFQDTNRRQRDIVEALNGGRGILFVVGDARQSIYRFRGAEVAVFRSLQAAIEARGGKAFELNESYRPHASLSGAYDDFLVRIMGDETSALEEYDVPFRALEPHRKEPRKAVEAPYLEMVCGRGETAKEGRAHSAQRLAARLGELHARGSIQNWEDVALLFRASTTFEVYENAFQEAGIPFVTIAGRGFYRRPEIRDVLNALHFLAAPWDALALSGWLRSPVVGVRDDTLMMLSASEGGILQVLDRCPDDLPSDEVARLRVFQQRAATLLGMVDRVPVSELLEELLNQFDFRASVAGANGRMLRNLEKLVQDAQRSGLIRVGDFLQYIQTLRDVGVREGEAPVEVHGAVQLMTVHKAKGLEFPVVVLADASYRRRVVSGALFSVRGSGIAARPDRIDAPLVYRFARSEDAKRDAAEDKRLLYVAATRAREMLILNGHVSQRRGKLSVSGWLGAIVDALDLSIEQLVDEDEPAAIETLPGGGEVRIAGRMEEAGVLPEREGDEEAWPISEHTPLFLSLLPDAEGGSEEEEGPEAEGFTPDERYARQLGILTHAVLEAGVQLSSEEQAVRLMKVAANQPFWSPQERLRAQDEALEMLDRLREDDLWQILQDADERFHEVPFVAPHSSLSQRAGKIDVLYRIDNRWFVLDFKTDAIQEDEQLEQHIAQHRHQLLRYAHAIEAHLGIRPAMQICFLNAMGQCKLVNLGMDRT